MKLEEEFKEQLDTTKEKDINIFKLCSSPFIGDKKWQEGDIPLAAMFIEDEGDINIKMFAPRHMDEILKKYALLQSGKFPKFVPIPHVCQSCGSGKICTGLDVENDIPNEHFRMCVVCVECYHKLDPDMWIGKSCWEKLNPKVPYELLPLCIEEYNPMDLES